MFTMKAIFVGIAVVFCFLLVLLFQFVLSNFSDTASVTYRVFAKYIVDGDIYTGSAVWNGTLEIAKFPTTSATTASVRGEAIALSGGGRNLFVIRRPADGWPRRSYGFFPELCIPSQLGGVSFFEWLRSHFSGPCEVQGHIKFAKPYLIEVKDLSDPKSIVSLDYEVSPVDRLCAENCLEELSVSRSDEIVSRGISETLDWLENLSDGRADIVTSEVIQFNSTAVDGRFVLSDFSTEIAR